MAGLYWHGDISGHYSDTRSPSVTEAELANYLNILRVTLHRDHLPSCLPSLFMVRYLMIVASLSMAASVLASPLAPPCLVFTPPLPRCHCPVQSHVTCESHLMLLTSLTLSLSLSSAYMYIQEYKSDTSIWLGLLKGAILLSADPKSVLWEGWSGVRFAATIRDYQLSFVLAPPTLTSYSIIHKGQRNSYFTPHQNRPPASG